MRKSRDSCILCGGAAPTRTALILESTAQLSSWNNEVASLLTLALSSTPPAEDDTTTLTFGQYCVKCRQATRDFALSARTAIKAIQQLVQLVPKIFQRKKRNGRKPRRPQIFHRLGGDSWMSKSEDKVKMSLLENLFRKTESNGDNLEDPIATRRLQAESLPSEDNDDDADSFTAEETWNFERMEEDDQPDKSTEFAFLETVEIPHQLDESAEMCLNLENNEPFEIFEDPPAIKEEPIEFQDSWNLSEWPEDIKDEEEVTSPCKSAQDLQENKITSPRQSQDPPTSSKHSKPSPPLPPSPQKPPKKKYKQRFRPNRYRPARERAKIARYPFPCTSDSCKNRFASLLLLTSHTRKTHLGLPRPFKCSECPSEHFKFPHLVEHIQSYHPSVPVLSKFGRPFPPYAHPCTFCPRHFKHTSELNIHTVSKHNPKAQEMKSQLPSECLVCSKRFKSPEETSAHFVRIHKDNPNPFTCEDCQLVCKNSVSLRFHVKKSHPTPDRVSCPVCKTRSFPSEYHLNIHNYHYHPKTPHKCPHCEFNTKVKVAMDAHKRQVHEDIYSGDFPCEVKGCGRKFKWRKQLKSHVIKKHTDRVFECVVCGKQFTNTLTLREHEAIHAGVRNICHICGIGLVTRSQMNRHMKNKHPEGSELVLPLKGRGASQPKPLKWKSLPETTEDSNNTTCHSSQSPKKSSPTP